jgi:nicotinate-nucleotide adenylyltransferase
VRGAAEGEQIAVFGGSFDPPHVAHVLAAAWVLAATTVDRLMVVPTFRHPLGKEHGAPYDDRVTMCELAMADLRRVEVSRLEEELGGEGRTLDLLEALRARSPDAGLRLVVGTDILRQTDRWHRWDRISALAPPIVVGRSGYEGPGEGPEMPEISSTDLRARLAAGTATDSLLPTRVARFIAAQGLYRGSGA